MKIRLFLLGLVASVSGYAETLDVSSRISAVTVYADRARVTRQADVSIPAGENVLRFGGLPQGLDTSSLQAQGSGSSAFKILGLEIRDKYSEQVLNERVRELEAQLINLQDQEAALNARKADLKERRAFLFKMRDGLSSGGSDEGRSSSPQGLDKIKPLYDFYSSELDSLSKQGQEADVQTRDLQPKRQVIEEELARLRGSGAKTEKEVLVTVSAKNASQAQVSVAYNMSDASWEPGYDARVNTQNGEIQLSSYGTIRQETGESWDDVNLQLSTARPSVGASMPDLTPWWVEVLQVSPRSKTTTHGYAADAMSPTAAAAPMEEVQDVIVEEAEINSAGISVVFAIKNPTTIPSDGEPRKVPITSQKFEGHLEYVTTPKLDEVVYLKTEVTNTSKAPLLGGEVNLFRDNDFVGQGEIDFVASGEKFDFFLGVDDGVQVKRQTLLDKATEGGLLQKRKGVTRKYETTIESFKSQPIEVTVYDQLPVSQGSSIVVANVKFNEAPTKQDKDTGKLTWKFTLDPKKKKILVEEFSVEWPVDKEVTGL